MQIKAQQQPVYFHTAFLTAEQNKAVCCSWGNDPDTGRQRTTEPDNRGQFGVCGLTISRNKCRLLQMTNLAAYVFMADEISSH